MDKVELRNLLLNHRLNRVADGIMALTRPAIRIQTTPRSDTQIPVGTSKMGGTPDLAQGITWPAWHEPMAFIGQLNLEDIRPLDYEHLLPEQGLLSFFFETNGEPMHSDQLEGKHLTHEQALHGWKVFYWDTNPKTFVKQAIPEQPVEPMQFPACTLQFSETWTIPSTDAPELEPLYLTNAERSAYIDIDMSVNAGNFGEHQLLGYGFYLDATPFLTAADRTQQWMNTKPEGRIDIERDINAQWLNLFQVQSSNDLEMDWAGGGLLHYSTEREALRRRDFSRVWVDINFL